MKARSAFLALFSGLVLAIPAAAEEATVKFAFTDTDVRQMIEVYAKASGKKVLVDPGVRGKATLHAPEPVSLDEAFNLLSSALEMNGFSITERDDLLYVASSRNMQRNLVPIYREAPPLKPSRMATMIIDLKHADASEINSRLRILPSKDGEMMPYEPTNQLIVNDYTPNLIRIHKLIQELDRPDTKGWKKEKKTAKIGGLARPRFLRAVQPQMDELDRLFED